VLLVVLASLLASCAAVRDTWLAIRNDDRTGEPAPSLAHAKLVQPDGVEILPDPAWRLLVFFLPT
jgi:hypothetical protein